VTAARRSRWGPLVTAFVIWFVHFMACWTAGEIWPQRWPANALAWGATAIALPALVVHFVQVNARYAQGTLSGWALRFARGAIAIAAVAVLFSAVPSLVFLP
jgi:hypothetical protein